MLLRACSSVSAGVSRSRCRTCGCAEKASKWRQRCKTGCRCTTRCPKTGCARPAPGRLQTGCATHVPVSSRVSTPRSTLLVCLQHRCVQGAQSRSIIFTRRGAKPKRCLAITVACRLRHEIRTSQQCQGVVPCKTRRRSEDRTRDPLRVKQMS